MCVFQLVILLRRLNLCKLSSKKNLLLEIDLRKRFRVEKFTILTSFGHIISDKQKHFLSLLTNKNLSF